MAGLRSPGSGDKVGAVRAYCDMVTALSLANPDNPCWWYCWLSSRDRFNNGLFDLYVGEADVARRRDGLAFSRLRVLKQFVVEVLLWAIARFHPAAKREGADVIIVAPATPGPLAPDKMPYRDTYFGPLVDRLREKGETPLLIGLPIANRPETVRALGERGDIPAASPSHFLHLRDLAAAAWTAITARLQVPGDLGFPNGRPAGPAIRASLNTERPSMFQGLLVERAMRRALAQHPDARVLLTSENNPWERAVCRAAHGATPPRSVTGYLHCAVLPSHLKNYKAPEDGAVRPAPDRIVCTGPAAREVLLTLGAYDPKHVAPGCALRDTIPAGLRPRAAPPRRIGAALALLEGLPSMAELLRFLAAAAPGLEGCRILLRAHPMMPLDTLLPLAGIELDGRPFAESQPRDLAAALEEADVAIYQSSSAAFSALAMGIPLIKIRLDDTLEDDPLLACTALKRVVRVPSELAGALSSIEATPPEKFSAEAVEARAYLDRYMAPVDDDALAPFGRRAPTAAGSGR